jgi:hypothetical protein
MPVPGKLCEQSETDPRGKIAEGRWGGVFAADAFRFIAVYREALDFSDFAHSFQIMDSLVALYPTARTSCAPITVSAAFLKSSSLKQ